MHPTPLSEHALICQWTGRRLALMRCSLAVGALALLAGCGAAASQSQVTTDPGVLGEHSPVAVETPQPAHGGGVDERAAALFASSDLRPGDLLGVVPRIEPSDDLGTYIDHLRASFAIATATALSLVARFEPVLAAGSRRWRVAASVRQGQIYEALAASASAAVAGPQLPDFILRDGAGNPVPLPAGVDAEFRDRAQRMITAAVHEQLEAVECQAILRYTFARDASIASFEAEFAAARLASYSADRRRSCIH